MTTIVQICPEIGPGSGVGGVAHHLEQQWEARGIRVERFTMEEAHGGWLPPAGPGVSGKLVLLARVLWFTIVGTLVARRRLRGRADVVSICHNDALVGDIYVNHGIVQAAMRARGHFWWRMVRNPLHLLTTARDTARYAGAAGHRLVVNLVSAEEDALRTAYSRLRVPTVVVGNGVDVDRFSPPSDGARRAARLDLGLADEDHVLLFVGHEFDRKGLPVVLRALERLPSTTHLLVVGGDADQIAAASRSLMSDGLRSRVHFVGVHRDPRPYFHAADVFVLPSAYESHALVILEALACGIPVIATPTGSAPDVIRDGENGFVCPAEPGQVAEHVEELRARPAAQLARAARATAEQHSWERVAGTYLDVISERFPASFGASR